MSYKPSLSVKNVSANYTVENFVDVVLAEQDLTITLPDPELHKGRQITIVGLTGLTVEIIATNDDFTDTLSGAVGCDYISDFDDWHKISISSGSPGGDLALNDLTDVNTALSKGTPIDADAFILRDSVGSNIWKIITWENVKITLKAYFDALYQAAGTYLTSANITGTITNGVTDKAPSEDAVFDALALKNSVITTHNNSLGANVSMATANTWYTGASFSLGAGTYLVCGTITVNRTATTAQQYQFRLRDTTNGVSFASGQEYQASVANAPVSVALSTVITLAGTATIAIEATSSVSTNNTILAATLANGQGNNATQISAIKIS